MDHVHTYAPSHPHADQMQRWPPHHAPHHIHMNPPQPPVSYDYPPWLCNFGYSSPMICHNCGSNSYASPHYFWRPPYSYNHPYNFPEPPQYTPPLNYQPWYDYQGKVLRENHHCCGCPNHLCSENETGNVKIEEEGESNRDWKKSDSMIPYQFQSWPYPVTWNSPRDYYIKGLEHGQTEKSRMNDFRNLGSSTQKDEDGERNRRLHQEPDNDARFPFPLIWMPCEPEEKENIVRHKMDDTEPKAGLETIKDTGLEQDIKVDQGKEHHKEMDISPVKNVNLDGERASNNTNGAKRQSTTKSKSSSKLPPVCLRVDPLPKRKVDNGSGRSSTPSGNMKTVNPKPNEANNSSGNSSPNKSTKSDDVAKSEVKRTKGITKTIPVTDGTTTDGVITVDKITTKQHNEDIPEKYSASLDALSKLQSEHPGSEQVENDAEVMKPRDATKEEMSKPNKRELTSEEAAVVIQSAYRGFDLRRWEPLKKLKQIAKVREEIAEVKNLIQELELSSDVRDMKQRTIISESIMSLLLKLDTIQGLHPSIRDARKSAVRELVTLQEKIDALADEQITIVDETKPSREGNLTEAPENYVDGESRANNNLEVSDNGGGSESSSENLRQVVPEPLVESSNMHCGTELLSESVIGKQDRKCEIGEEATVVTKNDDHEDLAIPQTCDLSSDQVKDLEQVEVDETSGSELRVDARGDEVNKEHVVVHQVTDGIVNDELMPENFTVDNSRICEDADFVREEKEADDENVEDSLMPERTVNESSVDNKVDDCKNLENDDSLISDSPNIIDETAGTIIGSSETSEDSSEDVKKDYVTCLALKEDQDDHLTGGSISDDISNEVGEEEKGLRISNDVPIEIREEEKCCIISDDVPSEVREEEKIHVISEDAPTDVYEEEEKNLSISEDDVPSEVHEQEEKNCCNSDNVPGDIRGEEEMSVEERTAPAEKVHERETKRENESHEKVSDDLETATESGERFSEHIKGMSMMESNKKLIEENEKLREMMEKLIKSGQDQLYTISNLSCRIEGLERKLSRKKRAVKITPRGGRKLGSSKQLMAQSDVVV